MFDDVAMDFAFEGMPQADVNMMYHCSLKIALGPHACPPANAKCCVYVCIYTGYIFASFPCAPSNYHLNLVLCFPWYNIDQNVYMII